MFVFFFLNYIEFFHGVHKSISRCWRVCFSVRALLLNLYCLQKYSLCVYIFKPECDITYVCWIFLIQTFCTKSYIRCLSYHPYIYYFLNFSLVLNAYSEFFPIYLKFVTFWINSRHVFVLSVHKRWSLVLRIHFGRPRSQQTETHCGAGNAHSHQLPQRRVRGSPRHRCMDTRQSVRTQSWGCRKRHLPQCITWSLSTKSEGNFVFSLSGSYMKSYFLQNCISLFVFMYDVLLINFMFSWIYVYMSCYS